MPNTLSQYSSVGGVTPTYDTNGNLTSDGTYSYGYDPESRLVSASGTGTNGAYTFDAQGSRKTVTRGGTTTVFVTDVDNREVLEYDGSSGAIQRWYAYGLGPNDVLNQMNVPANTRTTFVPDLLGSVVAAMASSTGTLSKFGYRPYGASSAAPTPFGFTGQRIDVEAGGLYYFRARAYSPRIGRFLQTDPIGYDGGINLYAYVGNDPLNLLDPYGLKVLDSVQLGLFGLSFCPSICGSAFSLLDAGISGFRGDYVGASISTAAAIAGIVSDAGAVKAIALGGMAAADALKAAKTIDPAVVRFSQNSISRSFRAGGSVDEFAAGLRSGTIKASDVPAVRLVEKNGNLFTLDNRRLEAFRRAETPIPFRMATPAEATSEAWKFTTKNGGASIRVRGE